MEGVHSYVSASDVPGDNTLGVIIHDEELFATKEVGITVSTRGPSRKRKILL